MPFVEVRDLERAEAIVKAFSDKDDFNAYVEDAQVRYKHICKNCYGCAIGGYKWGVRCM